MNPFLFNSDARFSGGGCEWKKSDDKRRQYVMSHVNRDMHPVLGRPVAAKGRYDRTARSAQRRGGASPSWPLELGWLQRRWLQPLRPPTNGKFLRRRQLGSPDCQTVRSFRSMSNMRRCMRQATRNLPYRLSGGGAPPRTMHSSGPHDGVNLHFSFCCPSHCRR